MSRTKQHSSNQDQFDTISKIKKPVLYKVVVLNDDFTPMDFVIHILQEIFNHEAEAAYKLMTTIHEKGSAIAGRYTKEVAETKVYQVSKLAKEQKYPLRCKLEQD
jgi:ATP-dependent Clp protease adaptor protein ClpS